MSVLVVIPKFLLDRHAKVDMVVMMDMMMTMMMTKAQMMEAVDETTIIVETVVVMILEIIDGTRILIDAPLVIPFVVAGALDVGNLIGRHGKRPEKAVLRLFFPLIPIMKLPYESSKPASPFIILLLRLMPQLMNSCRIKSPGCPTPSTDHMPENLSV
jgi:hypothetical protein